VSGCGYGGPFSGQGFDSMWTDMSEIVRPTRDGIHGREYINTGVDIGRKISRLTFKEMDLLGTPLPLLQSPLPIIFDAVAEQWQHDAVVSSVIKAASKTGLFAIATAGQLASVLLTKTTTLSRYGKNQGPCRGNIWRKRGCHCTR